MHRLHYGSLNIRIADSLVETLENTLDIIDLEGRPRTIEITGYLDGMDHSTVVHVRAIPNLFWLYFADDDPEPPADPAGTDSVVSVLDGFLQRRLRANREVEHYLARQGYYAKSQTEPKPDPEPSDVL